MYYSYMDTRIGQLLLAGDGQRLEVVGFSSGAKARGADAGWQRLDEPFRLVKRQLAEYFDGTRHEFELDLAPKATFFQDQVLEYLRSIPYGETRTYRDVAVAIGNPKAVRAVGGANANNPIPIIIPCHRVIGRDGTLTGFGGGINTKRYLLDLERSHCGLLTPGAQVAATSESSRI